MEKQKPETPKIEASALLNKMVALTLSRHVDLTEEEFIEAMNLKECYAADEEGAVREARFKLYIAITRELLTQLDAVKRLNAILKDMLGVTDEMIKAED